jgi:C4-dicarboxylate transporter, DctM subunit
MPGMMFTTMLLCFALSASVAVSIGVASLGGVLMSGSLPLVVVPKEMFSSLDKFPLLAVPFFILAGKLMEEGGISTRLVEFARAIVGGIQGGLALSCVLTCLIFAAVSGSSVATTFAVGSILIPALVRMGYPVPWAASLQATSAELGVIIPPSVPMILYGVAAEVSIGEMFVAGIGPGILITVALMAYVLIWARVTGMGKRDGEGRLNLWIAARKAFWALMMPVIILGGIYGGVFTPTEASAVAVIYALIVGVFIYRTLAWRSIPRVLRQAAVTTAVIMFIIMNAGLFSYLVNYAGVPETLGNYLQESLRTPLNFLIGVSIALFVIGMFVETAAAIIVLAPILAPVAVFFGIDTVHFGIIIIVNLALGMITPPVGVNLFAACAVARLPLDRMIRPLLPFVGVIILCLALISAFPAISLTLRDAVFR